MSDLGDITGTPLAAVGERYRALPRWAVVRRYKLLREGWQWCPFCGGRRTFHVHLPMACPRCSGTGKR